MPSWRDTLLEAFVPRVSKLTLVADPDGLLTEEQLARDLRDRGFDLIEYTNAVEFRYAYEAQYRAIWDRGCPTTCSRPAAGCPSPWANCSHTSAIPSSSSSTEACWT